MGGGQKGGKARFQYSGVQAECGGVYAKYGGVYAEYEGEQAEYALPESRLFPLTGVYIFSHYFSFFT